jgi:hypothetical protein
LPKQFAQDIYADLGRFPSAKWIALTFTYNAQTHELALFLNDRLSRKEHARVLPAVDQPMPSFLGGANAKDQRWR